MGYFEDILKRKPYELRPEQQKSYPVAPVSVKEPEKKQGFFQNLIESLKTGSFLPEPSPQLKELGQKAKIYAEQNQQGIQVFRKLGELYTKFATPEGKYGELVKKTGVDPFGAIMGIEDVSKKIITNIAKEKTPQVISGLLKKLGGIADDVIPELSQRLSKITKTSEVENIIGKVKNTAPEAQKVSKELQPLAKEARKYKSAEEFVKKIEKVEYEAVALNKKYKPYKLNKDEKALYDSLRFDPKTKEGLKAYDEYQKIAKGKTKEQALTDFYNQAVKGGEKVLETKTSGVAKSIEAKAIEKMIPTTPELLKEAEKIGEQTIPTKTIIRKTTGQIKEPELRILNQKLAIQEQAARKGASAGKKEAITEVKAIQDEKKFLASIKVEVLEGLQKEKNAIRKQIGFERFTKELDSTVLSRTKEKYGITEWVNANKEQLQSVLDDLRQLQKGDVMISRTQAESLKQFGVKLTTTKREAAEILGDVTGWKGRTTRFFDFFKTIDQKIEHVAGKDVEKVKNILTRPREKAVTQMFKEEIALKTEMRNMLDNFKINNKNDRALIMRFGEKRITLEELKKTTPKWNEIIEADKWFRKQYDNLLETTNKELARFYPENKLIPKRQDYYTHSQELGKMWDLVRNKGGDISPILEQVSEFTRPNRKFNPFALRRTGELEFVEDAGKAFEAYLNPILNNKYLTESIVRHRATADILAHKTLQTKNINQFIFSLRDAADSLAGKTNPFDRALMNRVLGRMPVQLINQGAQKLAKNRIIGNVGSALMQISGIPNSVLKNNIIRTAKGLLMQVGSPLLGKNDPLLKSDFLLRRYGEKGLQHGETVFKTIVQKGEKIASIPFEIIEKNITKSIWRASFDNALTMGYEGKALMQKADEICASVVGSRAIGEKAMAFESGVLSLPLQFQLEVNTHAQLWADEVFKKIFKDPVKATRAAIETSITLFLMNTFFEKTLGRTPLPDPIRAIGEATQADTWLEGVGRIVGEGLSSVAGGQFFANLLPENIKKKYFGRSEVGIYPGGIPISTAIQGTFKTPSNFVYDFVLPYGGGQLKKILQGIEGLDKMGSYNKSGKLQFPINQNQWLQIITFGKYSTKEAKEYFDKQRTTLSEKQTIEYFLRTQKGEEPQKVYQEIMKDRIRKEYEREIVKEVIKKIKAKPDEGLALIQLWKKQEIISNEMEKDIIDGLSK